MSTVIGIRFKDSGKTYHFDPQNIMLDRGDWAIVETVRGPELGRVAQPATEVREDELFGELKPVLRRATQEDLDRLEHLRQYEPEALQICNEKVAEHKLPMHLVKAEYNFDGSRLTFFFTADKRVDFRALVRDLARAFRTRIELRQVGPRDEAKLLGGVGPCGRLLCCATFLPDFARVSIKMAKDQDLPLNPSKISGVCGRLLCCLSYEHEQYLEIKAELPQRGDWVQTAEGPGEVIAVNVVKENVTVQLGDGNTIDCTAAQILGVRKRVAAEAQARNAEGITPAVRDRASHDGSHPIIDGEEGLFEDDDTLRELASLEDNDLPPDRPQPAARPQPIRPDVALGASLGVERRVPRSTEARGSSDRSPAAQPRAEQSRPPRQPHTGSQHHHTRPQPIDQSALKQNQPPAAQTDHLSLAAQADEAKAGSNARRRKRNRGKKS